MLGSASEAAICCETEIGLEGHLVLLPQGYEDMTGITMGVSGGSSGPACQMLQSLGHQATGLDVVCCSCALGVTAVLCESWQTCIAISAVLGSVLTPICICMEGRR